MPGNSWAEIRANMPRWSGVRIKSEVEVAEVEVEEAPKKKTKKKKSEDE